MYSTNRLLALFLGLTNEKQQGEQLFFKHIYKKYTENGRFYHNLEHITTMLETATNTNFYQEATETIGSSSPSLLYAIFYHDIIYKPLKQDNETQSAIIAETDLTILNLEISVIEQVKTLILATKTHRLSPENDTPEARFLLDLDLQILGTDEHLYEKYAQNIRQEYWLVPQATYNRGRTAVLTHFLDAPFIYKTTYFKTKFEQQAKQNLEKELKNLLDS